jgi:hypothetical protein
MNGQYFSCIGFTQHISNHFTLTTNKLNIMNCFTNFFQLPNFGLDLKEFTN